MLWLNSWCRKVVCHLTFSEEWLQSFLTLIIITENSCHFIGKSDVDHLLGLQVCNSHNFLRMAVLSTPIAMRQLCRNTAHNCCMLIWTNTQFFSMTMLTHTRVDKQWLQWSISNLMKFYTSVLQPGSGTLRRLHFPYNTSGGHYYMSMRCTQLCVPGCGRWPWISFSECNN